MKAFLVLSLMVVGFSAQAKDLKNLQLRTCQSDKEKCFVIEAGEAKREASGSAYKFKSASVTVLKRGPAGEYATSDKREGASGRVDLAKGEMTLDPSPGHPAKTESIRGQ